MDLSVIIPAYKAQETLGRALASIDVPAGLEVEIVVVADDGLDYGAWATADPRVKLCRTPEKASGPGVARNLGFARSKGDFLAYLDADDSWSPRYIETLFPIAKVEGCAFASTVVETETGAEILRLPPKDADRLMLADFAKWGASFHPLHAAGLPRGRGSQPFWEGPAQDVMHAVEVFMACGLTAPLVPSVEYRLRLGSTSVPASPDFSARVAKAYDDYDAALSETWAQGLFAAKSALNDRFQAERLEGESFYAFVARSVLT